MLGEIEGMRRRDDKGWDGWAASPTQWTWVWGSSGKWWRIGKPGVLQSMGSQRVRHYEDWTTTNFLKKYQVTFSEQLYLFVFPSELCENSHYFVSSSALDNVTILYFGHSKSCGEIPWYLMVVVTCTSLMTNDIEHLTIYLYLIIYLLAILTYSLVNCLLKLSPIFNKNFHFLIVEFWKFFMFSRYTFLYTYILDTWFENVISQSITFFPS